MKQRRFVAGIRWLTVLLAAAASSACIGNFGDKVDKSFPLGGTVTGLHGAVVLQNGGDTVTVTSDGSFTFPKDVTSGATYSVTVQTQPAGQKCTVANGSGTMTVPVTDVTVTCVDAPSYTIGGTVSNLSGTLVLRNGTELKAIAANGGFVFDTRVFSGQTYNVTIDTQPSNQTCVVTNGSGTVGNANVTNISVTCSAMVRAYSIGGTVSGLTGTVVLRNSTETLQVPSNGAFTFANAVMSGQAYSVTVATQPAGQACSVSNGSGTVANANVTDVVVTCSTASLSYSIGGSVTGLNGGTLQLRLAHGSSSSTISVTANGPFSFDPDKVPAGDAYSVTVTAQPTGQDCTVTNGTGTATANVTNVSVSCNAGAFTVGGTITGLTGSGLRIENGTSNSASVPAGAGSFTLPVAFGDGDAYDVGISAQPAGQTCVITHSIGEVSSQDITDIAVSCVQSSTDALVGTYAIPSLLPDHLAYLTLFADGVYVYGSVDNDSQCGSTEGNGVEYGVYSYDRSSGSFSIRSAVVDTNGSCGVWNNGSSFDGTLTVSGSGQDMVLTLFTGPQLDLVPVDSTAGQIFGSFVDRYHRNFWLFTDAGGGDLYFFDTETQAGTGAASGHDAGIEYACGSITGTPSSGTLNPDFNHGHCQPPAPHHDDAVDTNGTSGLSNLSAPWNFNVAGDSLSSPTFNGTRIQPN